MSDQIAPKKDVTNWALLAGTRFALAWFVTCLHVDSYFFGANAALRSLDLVGGKAAVIGFFLISGYSIAASVQRFPTGFYSRRLLRVYPIYFVAIAAAFILELSIKGDLVMPTGSVFHASGPVVALGNVFFLQTFLVKPLAYNVPVWSLALEVSYYALAPLLTRVPRWSLLAVIGISALSYASPRSAEHGIAYFLFTHFNMLTYAWAWFMGYYLFQNRNALVVTGFAGLGALLVHVNNYLNPEPYSVVTYLACFGIVLVAANNLVRIPNRSVRRVLNVLGNISYPLYLMQFPIILAAYAFLGLQNITALLLLTLAVSTAAYYLVDVYLKQGAEWLLAEARTALARPGVRQTLRLNPAKVNSGINAGR